MNIRRFVALLIILAMLPVLPVYGQNGGDTAERYTGTIDDAQPYMRIPVTVPENGLTLIADMRPAEGSDLDTLLYLVDQEDNILAENDDRARGDSSSLIVFPQADAGDYALIATRYKVAAGDSQGDFELTVTFDQGAASLLFDTSRAALEAAGYPLVEPSPVADWTVLVYYGGDNNLEPGILNDLDEFEVAGGSTDQINVLALVDRSPRFSDSNGNWHTTRLFRVTEDRTGDYNDPRVFPPTIDSPMLADLGELDTGYGETLAQFLVWGVTQYPAENYVIAIGSHGAGWRGVVTDSTQEDNTSSILSIPELQQAFGRALAAAGRDQFTLLINDACLMSSVEYYAGVAPYFAYSLASPEVVVDPALDMTAFLNTLKTGGDLDTAALGKKLVDIYITQDIRKRRTADIGYMTHALTDLDNFDPVVNAVEVFAALVNDRPDVYSTVVSEVRANTYVYTEFLGGNTRIDLGSFMRGVIDGASDSRLTAAAQAVLDALDDARLYGNAGERAERSTSYYNIYFPALSADFQLDYFEQSPLSEWGRMLRNYYNTVTPQVWSGVGPDIAFHPPVAPRLAITDAYPPSEVSIMDPVSLEVEIVGRGISYGEATVDVLHEDGTVQRLSSERILTDVVVDGELQRLNLWQPGVQVSSWFWDVTLPVISDGAQAHNELLIITEDSAFLDGRYREPGSDVWNDVGVVFSINDDFTGGVVQRVINQDASTDALAAIDIAPGSEFQVYRATVTADGRVLSEPGNVYTWAAEGLSWAWSPAPSGSYNLGLLLTASGGTTAFVEKSVEVNNAGLDETLRGSTWSPYWFTVPTRVDWERWFFSWDDRWMRTSSPDGTDNLTVYFSSGVGPDLQDIANRFLERYSRTLDGDFIPAEFAGVPALEVNYHYDTEAGRMTGRGYAIYHAPRELEMVFAAEALDGVGDLDASLDLLRTHTRLIDFTALDARDQGGATAERSWDFTERTEGWAFAQSVEERTVRYPVRLDWTSFDSGIWTVYLPESDPSGATYAAVGAVTLDEANTAETLLNLFVAQYVSPDATISSYPTYYGQNHTWFAALYTFGDGDDESTGRVYIAAIDSRVFVVWVQTPYTDEAAALFAEVFEPLIDGFLIGAE